MPKNVVICCDGTGEEFGDNNSNVVKIYSVLENSGRQATYYHPGLGTLGSRFAPTKLGRFWSKVKGLAFGAGLMDNLTDAYVFLMNQYEEGDAIYLFGFSRGAYTVRALAAFLRMFGLMRKGNESLVPYAIRRFRQNLWMPAPGQDSKQLWFAGTHCDIGGGLGSANSGLSDITLRWMLDEAVN